MCIRDSYRAFHSLAVQCIARAIQLSFLPLIHFEWPFTLPRSEMKVGRVAGIEAPLGTDSEVTNNLDVDSEQNHALLIRVGRFLASAGELRSCTALRARN